MKILVGIDGGPQQSAALTLAAQLAHGGELVVATVYPVGRATAGLGDAYRQAAEDAASEILKAAGEELGAASVDARAVAGLHPARVLHELAVEVDADLIVIGACHRGTVGRMLLGGTGESVVHGSPRPVVVTPRDFAGDASAPRRIGVAYDGAAEADVALAWAEQLARDTGSSLEILTVSQFIPVAMYPGVATYPTEEIMADLRDEAERQLAKAVERVTVPVDGRVLEGPVTATLVQAAEDLDLLVAGSRGYGPLGALFMGSVSRSLAHDASCPVVVVPRSAAAEGQTEGSTTLTAAQ
jgi:nucleotide-binding universal stress UspA family protein